VPQSLAREFKEIMANAASSIRMGSAFTDFMGPVISRPAFDRVCQYIKDAKADPEVSFLAGGSFDDSEGFFIDPTIIETTSATSKYMSDEIFGPFVCIYTYKDEDYGSALFDLIESTTEYALTGAVFAKNRAAIIEATEGLRFAAGNFYIKYVARHDLTGN
jgi:1-pyrroline-5-carboxylate dehydrogenase